MSSNDFVKVTFGLVFVVVLFVSRRLPRHIIRGDEDSISIEITGASPESANLLSRFLVRVVEKRSKPYYTWPEYQGQINALNAHFVDYNTIP